jgi:hypothetical protein
VRNLERNALEIMYTRVTDADGIVHREENLLV